MVLEVRDLVLLLEISEEVSTRGLLRFWSCSSPWCGCIDTSVVIFWQLISYTVMIWALFCIYLLIQQKSVLKNKNANKNLLIYGSYLDLDFKKQTKTKQNPFMTQYGRFEHWIVSSVWQNYSKIFGVIVIFYYVFGVLMTRNA